MRHLQNVRKPPFGGFEGWRVGGFQAKGLGSWLRLRVDVVVGARPTARLNRQIGKPIVIDQQGKPGDHLFAVGQLRPIVLKNVAGGEAVGQFALADARQDRLRRYHLLSKPRAIEPPGVAFQIARKRDGAIECDRPHRPRAAVGQMVDESQRRHQLAVFGEMAFQGRMQVAGSDEPFQAGQPVSEDRRRRIVEGQIDAIVDGVEGRAEIGAGQVGEPFEDAEGTGPRIDVQRPLDILPVRRHVGPNRQAEPLNHAVVGSTTAQGGRDIGGGATRLRRTEKRQANGVDACAVPADAVEGVTLAAGPATQEEAARRDVLVTVEHLQQRHDFVAVDQNAVRVRADDFAKGFVGGIGHDEALRLRFDGGLQRRSGQIGVEVGFQFPRVRLLGGGGAKLEIVERGAIGVQFGDVVFERLLLQSLQRLQGFAHGGRLHNAGSTDHQRP